MKLFWKRCISLMGLSLAVVTTGCITETYSLFPLSLRGESEAEPALLGAWVPTDGSRVVLIIENDDGGGYRITSQSVRLPDRTPIKPTVLEQGKLTRIGSEYFLSLSDPLARPRAYLFVKLAVSPERLSLQPVNGPWLSKKASGEGWLSHVVGPDGDVLITAPTEHLRQFFVAYLYDAAAFDPELVFTRTRPPASPAPEPER